MKRVWCVICLSLLLPSLIHAQTGAIEAMTHPSKEEAPPGTVNEEKKKNRLDLWTSYESLTDGYGNWKNLNLLYTRLGRDFTCFFQLGGFERPEKNAILFAAGAYKDWHERLYTYSAVSSGTDSDYLPSFRIDHDFNIKLGPKQSTLWTLGATFIDYYGNQKSYILSSGLTQYIERFIFGYRLFRNTNDPGSVHSFSHSLSATYGQEGFHWTNIVYSFGKQAYLATNLLTPQEINQNSQNITLGHRQWLGKDYGIFGDLSYFKLQDGYNKYGFAFGIFKEF